MGSISVNDFRDILICDFIFTCAHRQFFPINSSFYNHSVKKLKDISKYSGGITSIELLYYKNVFLLRVVVCFSKNSSEWARRKLISDQVIIILIYHRENLPDEVRVGIVRMKHKTLHMASFRAVFMLDGPAFSRSRNAV